MNTNDRLGFLGAVFSENSGLKVAFELGHVLGFQLLVLEISEKITYIFQFTGLVTTQESFLQAVEAFSHHLRFIVVTFDKLMYLFLCM